MRIVFVLALTVMGLVVAAPAQARVQRFALVIGNNQGLSHEEPLQFAVSDASRVFDVLRDLGGFDPVDMVLLRDEDATTVERALIAFNDRIRAAIALPDNQVFLFVYYSGHADREALHLGQSRLPIVQLAQLVRGSPANFRLLVLDACRSGALTRVKGGRITAPFGLSSDPIPNEGLAFLTASSSHEDAQESDEIKGSFFTHALLSGLLGAADRDGDGAVVLDEAYRYAYDATLRATSRTSTGAQHPTFQYDFRGRGDLVLTRPDAATAKRGRVRFPPKLGFMLFANDPDGAVVLELGATDPARVLSIQVGRYFVRGRGDDYLLEGQLDISSGSVAEVDLYRLKRVEYARLVRKGGRASSFAHGPQAGFLYRTPLPNADSSCLGATVGYGFDFQLLSTALRFGACRAETLATYVDSEVMEYDVELHAGRVWDIQQLSVEVGINGGVALFNQDFSSESSTPSRRTAVPFFGVDLAARYDVWRGLYTGALGGVATYVLRFQDDARDPDELRPSVAARMMLLMGKQL